MRPAGFPYRAVLSDIDGTLLDERRAVSSRTAAAVRRLWSCGVVFALVSGRMPSGIVPVREELGIPAPIVCYSGALVLDANLDTLHSTVLDADIASRALSLIKQEFPQFEPCYFTELDWYVGNASHPAVEREASIVRARPLEADLLGLIRQGRLPNKLFCNCADDPEASLLLAGRLRERLPEVNVIRSTSGTMVELVPQGVDKATGAHALLSHLDIAMSDALAFGDDANDVPLLEAVGRGVAVAGAAACARSAADDVAGAAVDDGVARYLEDLIVRG